MSGNSENQSWECCRTCLSSQSLNPIFSLFNHEKYTHALFTATGIKVDPKDDLPQEMCSTCINFVNQINKFRRTAELSQKELFKRLGNNQPSKVKLEKSKEFTSCAKPVTIDVSDQEDDDDDDNVTLDTFQYTCTVNRVKEELGVKLQAEYECKVQEFVNTPIGIFDGKKTKTGSKTKPVKRKPRVKKENKPDGCEEEQTKEKKEIVKRSIECEICHKILTSKHSLRNHYKIHTGFDVVCEHCGKKFITQRLLLMHCRAKHGYEKTDKCSFCDYKASNAEQVKIHERLHTGEKPFVCAHCGAGFHRRSSYLQHVAIHLPEKTVQCEKCPARFKSVTLMKIHLQRHRPPQYTFRCGVCEGSFARRRNVARHLQRVHATQPDESNVQRIANK